MFFGHNKSKLNRIALYKKIFENQYEEALSILKRFYDGKEIPDDDYFLMGVLLRKIGDYNGALSIQNNLLSSSDKGDIVPILHEIVHVKIATGDIRSAANNISEILKNSDEPALKKLLPELLYTLGEYEVAADHFKNQKRDEMASYCYYMKAQKYRPDDSEYGSYLIKAIKLNEYLRTAYIELSNYYFLTKRVGKGLDLLIEFFYKDLSKSLDDIYFLLDKFSTFGERAQFDTLLEKQISANSSNPFYYIYLSEQYYTSSQIDQSREILITYGNTHGLSKNILRQYIRVIGDSFLFGAIVEEHFYRCKACFTTFKSYIPICSNCNLIDTLIPL
ncbi:MAG: hypothetical protein N3C60_04850 [Calditerrivibrio sp.]|nr:hypothetical protein [Calditerrivibrio sp.]